MHRTVAFNSLFISLVLRNRTEYTVLQMAFNGAKSADYAIDDLSQGFSMLKVKENTRHAIGQCLHTYPIYHPIVLNWCWLAMTYVCWPWKQRRQVQVRQRRLTKRRWRQLCVRHWGGFVFYVCFVFYFCLPDAWLILWLDWSLLQQSTFVVFVLFVVVLFVGGDDDENRYDVQTGVVEAAGNVDNQRVGGCQVVAEKQQENYKSHLGLDYGEGSMGLYNWEQAMINVDD